jgi:hypothetical protein
MLNKLIQLLRNLLGFLEKEEAAFIIDTRLPQGMTEFREWADSIVKKSGLPYNESMFNALALRVGRLPEDVSHVPKMYFVRFLQKAAANQVAFAFQDEYKAKKLAEAEAQKAQAISNATT